MILRSQYLYKSSNLLQFYVIKSIDFIASACSKVEKRMYFFTFHVLFLNIVNKHLLQVHKY